MRSGRQETPGKMAPAAISRSFLSAKFSYRVVVRCCGTRHLRTSHVSSAFSRLAAYNRCGKLTRSSHSRKSDVLISGNERVARILEASQPGLLIPTDAVPDANIYFLRPLRDRTINAL